MKKSIRIFTLLIAVTMILSINILPCKADTVLTAEVAKEWNNLFDRTSQSKATWLGADGIFTAALDGDDTFGSADSSTKTVFFFSDTLMGASNADGKVIHSWAMPSHTSAVLTGDEPNSDNMKFIYGNGGNMSVGSHLFGERKWLLDCFVLKDKLYVLGFSPSGDWKPENTDMWEIPIENGEPQYTKYKKTANIDELFYRTSDDRYLYAYGIGITKIDGYIYIYGYRDAMKEWSRKDLIVSRIKEDDFPDFSKLSYWDGQGWCNNITESQPILDRVSCEMSVTPITSGTYKGKYIAVYTQDTQSERIAYAIGDSPVGPFDEGVVFYETPEHDKASASGDGKLYTYNAKAHPHLSKDRKLLVSYNCNVADGKEQYSVDYHPRFLWLDLDPDNEGGTESESEVSSTVSSETLSSEQAPSEIESTVSQTTETESVATNTDSSDGTESVASLENAEDYIGNSSNQDDTDGGISPLVAIVLPVVGALICVMAVIVKRKK